MHWFLPPVIMRLIEIVKGEDTSEETVAVVRDLANKFGIKEEVALGTNGILGGKELRYYNEPVRHKTLDLIGDLALLGMPVQGRVRVERGGHSLHRALVQALRDRPDSWQVDRDVLEFLTRGGAART